VEEKALVVQEGYGTSLRVLIIDPSSDSKRVAPEYKS
jgi:hypothetical protein